MENLVNDFTTNLAAACTNSQTTITVNSSPAIPPNFRARIDDEVVLVTAVAANVWTVSRGQESTAAASHTATAQVSIVITAGGMQQWLTDNQQTGHDIKLLHRWMLARADAVSKRGTHRVLCLGTSITTGRGSTGLTGDTTNLVIGAYPTFLADILALNGIPATSGCICGDHALANTSAINQADPRITPNAGWIVKSPGGEACIGGLALQAPPPVVTSLNFTPPRPFDTIVIGYLASPSAGTFTVNVDGTSTIATINTVATYGHATTAEISCTLGTHSINIARNGTGADIYIEWVIAYNKSIREIAIMNAGIAGGLTSNDNTLGWTQTNAAGRLESITNFAPDLTIIELGINDCAAGVTAATFTTNMQTLIDTVSPYSDIILVIWCPNLPATSPEATQVLYRNAIKQLAATNNLPVIDMPTRWTSNANMSLAYASGTPGDHQSVHLTATGYYDMARAIANTLLA
jgi:lysophospholipase L1-like esterase